MEDKKLLGGKWLLVGSPEGAVLFRPEDVDCVRFAPLKQYLDDEQRLRTTLADHVVVRLKSGQELLVDDPDLMAEMMPKLQEDPAKPETAAPRVLKPKKLWMP